MPPVAILAGGLATRMRPITEKIPKSLISVAGEAFIFHQLRLLKKRGVHRVVLCVSYLGEMIEAKVGDGSLFGLEISYSYDGEQLLGTAGALKKALPQLGDVFFVTYGDSYLSCDYEAVYERYQQSGQSALMTIYRNENLHDVSNIILKNGKIVCYDKVNHVPQMQYIDYGLGILCRRLVDRLEPAKPYDLADIYMNLVKNGELACFVSPERFYEIGSPAGLNELSNILR
ncbi:MAG: nucleotidyltransferase family protein [Holosporaceae bacterium]|nr:nucleotidyltransferase family protein [Holosporaceae bacterium]